MKLPRLPVSRRRHDELAELVCTYNRIASEDLAEYKRRARKAEARAAELEQAIREFCDHTKPVASPTEVLNAAAKLRAVLDGDDRQEADERKPCYVCGSHWGTAQRIYVGGDRWLHADCQDRVERTSVNYRPERGYASSAQPPTGNPPSDPGPGGRR